MKWTKWLDLKTEVEGDSSVDLNEESASEEENTAVEKHRKAKRA